MKNAIAIIISFMLFILWFFPAFTVSLTGQTGWGALYVPIFVMSLFWGNILYEKFL